MISFTVIDNQTGKEPDLWEMATNEDWAKHLMYCDMEGFAISEDGTLLLLGECGNFAYCPEGRFTVTIDPEELRPKGEWVLHNDGSGTCTRCNFRQGGVWDFDNWQKYCGKCGAKMRDLEPLLQPPKEGE